MIPAIFQPLQLCPPNTTTQDSFDSIFNDCVSRHFGGQAPHPNFGPFQAAASLVAGGHNTNNAAMVAAIWGRESSFNPRPTGDHGPAQLTSWWSNNHPSLIVPGSYDSFSRPAGSANRERAFTGDVNANLGTLHNIIVFSYNRYGNLRDIAYHYGPPVAGDRSGYNAASREQRNRYADDVMANYGRLQPFFNCINQRMGR